VVVAMQDTVAVVTGNAFTGDIIIFVLVTRHLDDSIESENEKQDRASFSFIF
jgi:hypothetical protein